MNWKILLLWLALLWGGTPLPVSAGPVAQGQVTGDPMVYKKVDGEGLHLYVVKPAGWKATDHRPAMVFFHGGGWVSGPVSQFNEQSQYLASRGMVCVQVEYRLIPKGDQGPPVVCCEDAKSAMRWVRGHAAELGIDPNRIAASGGSAGGQLAAFISMVPGMNDPADDLSISPRAEALVLFNPVFDNGPDGGYGHREGCGYSRMGKRYQEFSPAQNITPNAPPAVVFLGTKDYLIPTAVAERFKANMEKAGVRCDLHLYQGRNHGFFNQEPYRTATLFETDKFLESLGWLEGKPTLKMPKIDPNASRPDKKNLSKIK
jgi:acetyl esterase/lipase